MIGDLLIRFVSKTPYLIEYAAIAPYITGTRILAKYKSLRGRPFNRNLPPMGHIVIIINQIPRHSKVTDLQGETKYDIEKIAQLIKLETGS